MLIESFHIGDRGQRRYCSLHRPLTRLVRSTGVVLCYPLGHEYYRAHRSYVKLADQLAHLGFPVLRFDYSGSGDSEGETGHDRLADWLAEIDLACVELRNSEPVSSIALGGMRGGATLALLAARRVDAQALLLWDPVCDGAGYLDELRRLHAGMLDDLERFSRRRHADDCSDGELVGTQFGSRFLRELAALNPDTVCAIEERDVLLVRSRHANHSDVLRETLRRKTRLHAVDTSGDYGWTDVRRIGETIIDPGAVRHIASYMNAVAA